MSSGEDRSSRRTLQCCLDGNFSVWRVPPLHKQVSVWLRGNILRYWKTVRTNTNFQLMRILKIHTEHQKTLPLDTLLITLRLLITDISSEQWPWAQQILGMCSELVSQDLGPHHLLTVELSRLISILRV